MVMMDHPPPLATEHSSSTTTTSSSTTSTSTTSTKADLSSSGGTSTSAAAGSDQTPGGGGGRGGAGGGGSISRIASALKKAKSNRSSITWSNGTDEIPPGSAPSTPSSSSSPYTSNGLHHPHHHLNNNSSTSTSPSSTPETPRSGGGRRGPGHPATGGSGVTRPSGLGFSSSDHKTPSAPLASSGSSFSAILKGSREGREWAGGSGGSTSREGWRGDGPHAPLITSSSLRGLTSKSNRRSLQLSLSNSGSMPTPKNGIVTPAAVGSTGGGGSMLGGSISGSRLSGFPQCPLQPDLDLLNKFRAKEHEYCRERNGAAIPFQFIDRTSQRRSTAIDYAEWADSSDDDFDESISPENGGANQTTKQTRMLIQYRPRPIQPTKLAEDLTRNYKKWHAEMTLKLEAKKAESKRKGNKGDFGLAPTTPRDRKKKDSFRKSTPPEKIESSPRQSRQQRSEASASPRKSAREKGKEKESKSGEGWVKSTMTKSSAGLPSPKRPTAQEPLRAGAPVRQPEDEDGEGRQNRTREGRSPSSDARKRLTLSSGTVSVESSMMLQRDKADSIDKGRQVHSARSHTQVLSFDGGSESPSNGSPAQGNGISFSSSPGGHSFLGANGDDSKSKVESGSSTDRSLADSEQDSEENAKEREPSFLSSLKSMANRKSVRRKSATANDLMSIVNSHGENGDERDGSHSSGFATTREKRERSESAKVRREKSFGRLSELAGMVTAIGKDKNKEKEKEKDEDKDKEQLVNKQGENNVHQTSKEKDGKKAIKKTKRRDSELKS